MIRAQRKATVSPSCNESSKCRKGNTPRSESRRTEAKTVRLFVLWEKAGTAQSAGRSDFRFDRKMRIAPSARFPISSAHAQDDRPDHPLFRNARSAHQHVEPRRLSEPGADVVGVVAGLELHAGLGPDGTDFRQPHPNARVCYQSALGRSGHACRPPRTYYRQESCAGEEASVGVSL